MQRFWKTHILPIIEAVKPQRIMEIGAEAGENTKNILDYCRTAGCEVDIIDPAPKSELHDVLQEFEGIYSYYPLKGLEAIPLAPRPDLVLMDGDHNWYTVYHELAALIPAGDPETDIPVVLFHDVAWPYGRRDMYYNSSDIPEAFLKPHARMGMVPGHSELRTDGMNSGFANAATEGGPMNGVLTAVEDFIAAAPDAYSFWTLPFFNGFGVLVPKSKVTPALLNLIESFYSTDGLLEACRALELESIRKGIMLKQRTEELKRAKQLLEERHRKIGMLEEKLAAAKNQTN